jgi:hypothetical protein
MEVPLQLMTSLAISLATDQKRKELSIQYYRDLFQMVFEKNMLNSWPVLNNNLLTLEQYQEMIYRSSFFFKGEQLCQLLLATFF